MSIIGQVRSGELVYKVAAEQMPQLYGDKVVFQGNPNNDGNVYIGGPGVTVPDESADTTSGISLDAGVFSPVFEFKDLSQFYYIMDTEGDSLIYFIIS